MKKIKLFAAILVCMIIFTLTGCQSTADKSAANSKILVAYFSRTGNQHEVGNISEGNTAIIAKMIAKKTGGDLFEIKVLHDNYPTDDYYKLASYAKKEQAQNARPALAGKVENFSDYRTIFIGYPIWWGDKPMPVYTFIESYKFKGKTVVPFCTHEGSGLDGNGVFEDTGATVLEGIGIFGHTAQNESAKADKEISEWLKKIGY